MSGRDLALTGIPRGGTTLACHLLGLADNAVALSEPMDVARLPDTRNAAVSEVRAFLAGARARLLDEGLAPSKLQAGRVPDNPFAAPDPAGARRQQVAPGLLRIAPPPAPGFTLVVKHNALFTALLPELAAEVETVAIVRNPLAVLASWHSLRLPVSHGRLPAGERLDPALARALDSEPDTLARQLHILAWCFSRFANALPRTRVLRYEDVVASQGQALFAAAALRGNSDQPLRERNDNRAYGGTDAMAIAGRLLACPGDWRAWYPDDEIGTLAQRLSAAEQHR